AAQAAAYTFWGGTDTGTASALVFAVTPAITSYVIGGIYKGTIGAGHTNTASASANFGGGPRNIKLPSGDAIPAAALIAGQTYAFLYTGTNFIALNPTFGIGLRAGEVVVAAATTTDILGAASEYIGISGAGVNITSFGTGPNRRRVIYFAGANTIVHNNAAIICPGKQDMPVAAGDCLIVESSASSVARIVSRTALIGDRFDTFDVGAIINVDYTMLGGTSRTITLPAASAAAAWSVFPVHNISSVPFTVQRAGGDGLTNYAGGSLILQPGEGMLFYTDGASTWRMLGLESPDYLGRRGAPDIIIEDQKSSGTAGGTFTSGADRTRDLNTIVADPFGYCSVASNQFTLQPGTWYLKWSAPALKCANHQSHLYNVTGAAVQQRGSTEFTGNSSGNTTNRSMGSARFTIAVATTFEIRHRCTTTESSDGFGQSASYGTEVYTRVEGWKIK
ncbi:MAG: hypothetical protein J0H63_15190, partial [Rhizobiales bacterium]|nr:hypothetical protein [Hyphomicrobiales bacterium]